MRISPEVSGEETTRTVIRYEPERPSAPAAADFSAAKTSARKNDKFPQAQAYGTDNLVRLDYDWNLTPMKITSLDITPVMQIQVITPPTSSPNEGSDKPVATSAASEVNISKAGQEKLEDERYADIDRAPLPEDVKESLKNIRRLQEKIAEKSKELMELATDKTLSDDDLKRRREVLTTELRSMQSALGEATSALNNAMSNHNMDTEGRSLAKGLVGLK